MLALVVIFLTAIFPMLILKSNANEQLKRDNKNYEHQLKIQAEHYKNVANANFELRRFRHDFSNLKIGLTSLIESKKFDEAIDFLATTNQEIENNSTTNIFFDTGNGIVDALLSDKQRHNPDIKIIFEGGIISNRIEPTDLCVLFGNTLDNAIEACNKLNNDIKKEIYITSKCACNCIFLHIINPTNEPIKIKNNTIVSTKTNKDLHGFGLYSLEKTVKKYDGELELSCDNNTFSVDISLPLK